jgi:ribosomal protein S27AE
MKEQCINCGRDDVPLFPIDKAFMPSQYKVCGNCKGRFDQAERDGAKLHSPTGTSLAAEADRLMLEYTTPEQFYCYKCGDPVLMDAHGQVPLYCTPCMYQIFAVCKRLRD